MTNECWIAVPGYEGYYEANCSGKIRSVGRTVDYVNGGKHYHPGIELKQRVSHNGYLRVSLARGGQYRYFAAHRVIALCFIGELPDGLQVNHKNGIKTDNRVENLEYVTASENRKHAFSSGLQKRQTGDNHHGAKLTSSKVREIKSLLGSHGIKELSLIYKVSTSTVGDIKHGRTWIDV